MKKLTTAIALLLCLTACVFAFASCGKDKKASTTAAPATTDDGSGCAHVWNTDYTVDVPATCAREGSKSIHCSKCGAVKPGSAEAIEKAAHVPAEDYTTDMYPTCKDEGIKSKHCVQCGQMIDTTIVTLPVDDTAHVVESWIVTKQPSMFDQADGSRHGTCTVCHKDVQETIKFQYTTAVWTEEDADTYNDDKVNFVDEVLKNDHMYPTTEHPDGLDLLVEYSILWNESMLNLVGGSKKPFITTQISYEGGNNANHLVYWSPVSDNDDASCKFAGGFEFGTLRTSEAGNPYPKMTTGNNVGGVGNTYADFPNFGGTDQEHPEYGWHRFQFRLHEEVTNLDAVKNGEADPVYKLTGTIYIDGEVVSILSGDVGVPANRPYDVESDGAGGVTYSDISEDRWVCPLRFNSITAKEGKKVYLVYTDLSVTIGTNFVQNVEKVASPAANNYTAEDGTVIAAPIYFKLK